MHTLKKLATSKKKYYSVHYVVVNLGDALQKSLDWTKFSAYLENLLPTLNFVSNSSKVSRKKSFHPIFSGTSKLGSWIDVANAFNDFFAPNFNMNSYETQIPVDSPSLIFFKDIHGSISESDILQVILKSTACSYETHENFPNGLLKKCSGVFATFFRFVFNCVILKFQYPDIWKFSFIIPIHKGFCRNDNNNYRPISLLL